MSQKLKLSIAGADGRMGQNLIRQTLSNPNVSLASALVMQGSKFLDKTVDEVMACDCLVKFTSDYAYGINKADVVIDFTRPDGTIEFIKICRQLGKKIVIGTTGFTEEQETEIENASCDIAIVKASNMAPGVNVLFYLTKIASKLLSDYDAEIFEMHHRHKVDAPSGTALTLFDNIVNGRAEQNPTKPKAVMSRAGHTGEREAGAVGFSVARGGDVVGEHTVMLLGEGERLELRHISTTRSHYAYGAISAAEYLANKSQGLYNMAQVLGLPQS